MSLEECDFPLMVEVGCSSFDDPVVEVLTAEIVTEKGQAHALLVI